MAERDAATVDVYLLGIELEIADAGDRLGGESLVQLHEIDLIDRETSTCERLLRGGNRPETHAARIYPGDGGCHNARECCSARLARHQQCCRAIVDPARARRGDGAVLPKCRLRSEEHTSELQSLITISYAVFC